MQVFWKICITGVQLPCKKNENLTTTGFDSKEGLEKCQWAYVGFV